MPDGACASRPRDFLHSGVITVPNPYTGDEIRSVTHCPRVPVVIGGAGFRSGRAGELQRAGSPKCWCPGGVVREDIGDDVGVDWVEDPLPGWFRRCLYQFAGAILDSEDGCRMDPESSVGKGCVGSSHLLQRDVTSTQGER